MNRNVGPADPAYNNIRAQAWQKIGETTMENLTQTVSNLVGILIGIVGVVGTGFFIYGAYLYLTASGAPHQMERGKSAMMTALAGIVLALVAFGVVELVMNAVVGAPVETPQLPEPAAAGGSTDDSDG